MSGAEDETKVYPRPSLTADIVVVALDDEARLRVLFIRRGKAPFQGCWALPGGFCEPGETAMQAAARELTEETELRDVHLEELVSCTTPGRDPRGWVVSIAHLALLPKERLHEAKAGDDAAETAWLTLRIGPAGEIALTRDGEAVALAALAFDHREVIAAAVARLRERVGALAPALLAAPFSLEAARAAFEAILGKTLDPQAFTEFVRERGWVRAAEPPESGFVPGPGTVPFPWALARKD